MSFSLVLCVFGARRGGGCKCLTRCLPDSRRSVEPVTCAGRYFEVGAAGLRSPTLVIIGQVVSLLRADAVLDAADILAAAAAQGGETIELTAQDVAAEIELLRRGH